MKTGVVVEFVFRETSGLYGLTGPLEPVCRLGVYESSPGIDDGVIYGQVIYRRDQIDILRYLTEQEAFYERLKGRLDDSTPPRFRRHEPRGGAVKSVETEGILYDYRTEPPRRCPQGR